MTNEVYIVTLSLGIAAFIGAVFGLILSIRGKNMYKSLLFQDYRLRIIDLKKKIDISERKAKTYFDGSCNSCKWFDGENCTSKGCLQACLNCETTSTEEIPCLFWEKEYNE